MMGENVNSHVHFKNETASDKSDLNSLKRIEVRMEILYTVFSLNPDKL